MERHPRTEFEPAYVWPEFLTAPETQPAYGDDPRPKEEACCCGKTPDDESRCGCNGDPGSGNDCCCSTR